MLAAHRASVQKMHDSNMSVMHVVVRLASKESVGSYLQKFDDVQLSITAPKWERLHRCCNSIAAKYGCELACGCRSAINSWLLSSMANANLLKEAEMVEGRSSQPNVALNMGDNQDLLNTFETLPDEDEQMVQQQYPRS